jgi:hypothetical protein
MKQIVVEFPLVKATKNRVKYIDNNWKTGLVCGQLYVLHEEAMMVFGHFPTRIRLTIEEVA